MDPDTAAQIHPNHSQRLSRALEVYRASGKTMTELRQQQSREQDDLRNHYDVKQFAIAPRDRSVLHERIGRRFKLMLKQGLVEEVQGLFGRTDLHIDLPAIRAVGYRQVWEYLAGEIDYDTMSDKGVAATRQLAKRQLTWLRGWSELQWLYTDTETGAERKKTEILSDLLNFLAIKPL